MGKWRRSEESQHRVDAMPKEAVPRRSERIGKRNIQRRADEQILARIRKNTYRGKKRSKEDWFRILDDMHRSGECSNPHWLFTMMAVRMSILLDLTDENDVETEIRSWKKRSIIRRGGTGRTRSMPLPVQKVLGLLELCPMLRWSKINPK